MSLVDSFEKIPVEIFENDSIAELWDFGQAVPEDMENENGMF